MEFLQDKSTSQAITMLSKSFHTTDEFQLGLIAAKLIDSIKDYVSTIKEQDEQFHKQHNDDRHGNLRN